MREFIRHPNDIPIACDVTGQGTDERLKDVSEGGLCFVADEPIESGSHVHIEIPVEQPPFRVDGTVVWCRPAAERYDVGVQFSTETREFSVRMVEQICQIEHYRKEILATEGRELSCEEAAREWIARNAADFPR
jgi:Tfp pilus assembly protein PilZ